MHFEDHLDDFVKEFKGNWMKFDSFGWSYWRMGIEDPENWGIFYTHNRDSGISDLSNASVWEKEMEPFIENGSAHSERHGHWGVGWVDGYSVRVVDENGNITDAAKKVCELQLALQEYPILDDSDHSQREYDAAIENISFIASGFVSSDISAVKDGPDWCDEVFSWLWDNEQEEVQNHDDEGAYPSEDSCKRALKALGYLDPEYNEED